MWCFEEPWSQPRVVAHWRIRSNFELRGDSQLLRYCPLFALSDECVSLLIGALIYRAAFMLVVLYFNRRQRTKFIRHVIHSSFLDSRVSQRSV